MDNYVFISYAHKDKKIVSRALEAMDSCGISYWYDKGIEAGSDWALNVGSKLSNAKAVVLFLSKAASKSKNVLREIEFARKNNIPIIPVQLYPFKLPKNLEKSLSVNQFTLLNSFKTYKEFAKSLCIGLKQYDVIGPENANYQDKKVHISGKRRVASAILFLLILIILAITAWKAFVLDIPTVIGMETPPAELHVNESGFDCAVTNGYSDDEDYGFIFDQNKRGSGLKNSTVVITQSLGPEVDLITVPNVVGHHVSEGVSMLVSAGMKTFVIDPISTNEYDIAYIAGQSIAANYKVSSHNKMQLQVSSAEDTIIEILGQKIQLKNKKLEVQITDKNEVVVTPLMVFGISANYTETDPLTETINAKTHFLISVKREDTDYYGKYRGRFVMETRLTGDDSLGWKILQRTLGDKSGIFVQVKSESFSCESEKYDDVKYKHFVEEVTGSSLNAISYVDPIMMILGKDIVLTNMSPLAKNLDWLYSLTTKFVFSIPKLDGDTLLQPYSIIVQRNGKVYVALYGRDGEQRAMEFHGDIKYE